LSIEEVLVFAGHKVLVESDDNNTMIVGDAQAILGLKPGLKQSTYLI